MSNIKLILDAVGLEEGSPERNQVERELRNMLKRKLLSLRNGDPDEYEEDLHARAKALLEQERKLKH